MASGGNLKAAWLFHIEGVDYFDESTVVLFGKLKKGAMKVGDSILVPTKAGTVFETEIIMIMPVGKKVERITTARASRQLLAVYVNGHGARVDWIAHAVAESWHVV